MDTEELQMLDNKAGADGDVLPEVDKNSSVNGNLVDHQRLLPELVEDPPGQILSPILHASENEYDRLKHSADADDIEIESTALDNDIADDNAKDVLNELRAVAVDKQSEEQELDRKSIGSKTVEVAVNIVSSRSESTQGSESYVESQEQMQEFGLGEPVKVLVNFPEDILVTCKATLMKLDSDETFVLAEKPDVETIKSDDNRAIKSISSKQYMKETDVVDFVRENFETYDLKREQYLSEHFIENSPESSLKNEDNSNIKAMSDGVKSSCRVKVMLTGNRDAGKAPVSKTNQLKSTEAKYDQSDVSNVHRDPAHDDFVTLSTSPKTTMKTRGVSVGTNSPKSCCAKGHICFDCFPIPDELLNQLHQQTGMSRLSCLQAAQTVVKYYKTDLVSSNYFSYEDKGGEHSNESSFEGDGYFGARNMSTPPTKTKTKVGKVHLPVQTNEHEKPETFGLQKLSRADQFRGLVQRLKTEKNIWRNSQNVSYVFAFLRSFNKVMTELDRSALKKLILQDSYEFISILITLLEKEYRWSVQWEILGILGIIASRDGKSKRKLIESNLPVLLSKEILDAEVEPSRLGAYAELLTVLFTTGVPLPIYLMEEFGVKFVVTILDMIESDYSEPGWALPDALIRLLLAYNLQFSSSDVYDNLTIHAIARIDNFKTFTNRLVDLLEQEDQPLTHWEANVSVHQCVVKMMTDIYLCRTTAHIFTVTQSILIIRRLTKGLPIFSPGDKRRTAYLKLVRAALHHCKYDYIRFTPSLGNLQDILLEETSLSSRDQEVIRSIFKSFPNLKQ